MRRRAIISLFAAALAVTACASYGDYGTAGYDRDYGDYGYDGRAYGGHDGDEVLDPWLSGTEEGRDVVRFGFRGDAGGIDADTAHRANIWFRRYADTDDDLRLTDEEIRIALVQAARDSSY